MKHPNSKVARSLAATQVPPVWACVLPAERIRAIVINAPHFASLRIRSLHGKSVSAAEDAATVMRMPHLRRSGLDVLRRRDDWGLMRWISVAHPAAAARNPPVGSR